MGKKKTTTTNTGLDPASQQYVNQMRQTALSGAQTALNGPGGQPQMQYGAQQQAQPNGFMGTITNAINSRLAAQGANIPGYSQAPNAPAAQGGPGGGSWFTGPQTMSIGDQAAQFFNPYMSNVVNATQGQYDQLRAQALNQGNTVPAGAFGGSRQAVAQGARLGQLDVGQANTISNLLNSGYQNALQQGTAYTEQQRQLQQQQLQEPLFRQQIAQQLQQGGLGPTGSTSSTTESGNWASTLGNIAQLGAGAAATYFGAKGMSGGGGGGGLQVGGQVPQQYMPGASPNIFQGQYPGSYNPQFQPQGGLFR